MEEDIRAVALMPLRQRRSEFMIEYFRQVEEQDQVIQETLDSL